MITKPYQHPRLTKSKASIAIYDDHMQRVEAWDDADARRAACEKKLKEEEEYIEKRNERLRVMVVPKGRERLKQHMQYSRLKCPYAPGAFETGETNPLSPSPLSSSILTIDRNASSEVLWARVKAYRPLRRTFDSENYKARGDGR
jgi:hypothetical protein